MKRPPAWSRVLFVASTLSLVSAPYLHAQTAPAPAPAKPDEEETIVLSPFVVEASEDSGSYQANSTLAGTRVRTDLKDVSSSISVVTQQFLQDTGSHNAQDLLVYVPNTEVGGLRGNYSGQAQNASYNEPLVNPSSNTRVRGLDTADNTRNYFLTDIPFDSFNVGRVDLQRGPNSILFGVGSPAGIINASVNNADFKTHYKVENVTSQYGSERNSVDLNQVLVHEELAIRFAALNDQQKYEQKPAFNNTTRYYGALRFDPKIFTSSGSHTSLRVNYENGSVKSDNPRTLPPDDQITRWFLPNTPGVYDATGGLGRATINEYVPGQGAGSNFAKNYFAQSWAQGRVYWPIPVNYFNGSDPRQPGISPTPSSQPTYVNMGEIPNGWAIDSNGNTHGSYSGSVYQGPQPIQPGNTFGIGGLPNFQSMAIPPYRDYASAKLPGGSYYADKVLTDPSVFDFYHSLLDGTNKREWQNWNAFDVAFSQTFFNDRLGFEVVYDQQDYKRGQVGFMQGENYGITIDVNQTFANGAPNPNVGRPMATNGAESGNQSAEIKRDTIRATTTAEIRGSDFFGNTLLAKIIGRHVFTGLFSIDHRRETDVSWSQYASTPDWETLNNEDLSVKIANYRLYDWVAYLGNSLGGASSAANAHLTNINVSVAPAANTSVTWFNSHWKYSLNPSDPTYVNPAATASPSSTPVAGYIFVPTTNPGGGGYFDPKGYYAAGHSPTDAVNDPNHSTAVYSYLNTDTFDGTQQIGANNQFTRTSQNNNPANYVGWQQAPVTWMNANNPQDFASLVTGGSKSSVRIESKALVWQGYLFDSNTMGQLVTTYGWREDQVTSNFTGAPINQTTSIAALDYALDPANRRRLDGQTRTWGGVYHLPTVLTKHLPWDSTLSVIYNDGSNFQAGQIRSNIAGNALPNPDGVTKEYGAMLTLLDDKITLKATHYKTTVHNATLSTDAIAGLGGLGYLEDLIPAWGWGYAAQVQAGLDGKYGNTTINGPGDTAGGTKWNYAAKDASIINGNADLSVLGTPAGAANAPVATYGYGGSGPVSMTQIVNAWLHMPVPDNFFDAFGITGNRPNPAQARATGKLYLGFSQPFANGDVPGVGGQQPSGQAPSSTVDNVSTGWEYELTAHPTKNWNITINYSKTAATKTNIDSTTVQFMKDNLAFYQGPGGQLRLWGASQSAGYGTNLSPNGPIPTYAFNTGDSNGSTVGPQWIKGVYNGYLVVANSQGQSAPEVSPWRLNLISSYSFDRGFIKGAFVGGAFREEAGRILGYKLLPDNSTLDVHSPFIGPNDNHFDLWVGYARKIAVGRKFDWRIQLNLRDVGKKATLVPARYEPDGSLALARIQDGMSWSLTNTFEF